MFDTSNYKVKRPPLIRKTKKKKIELMKGELDGKTKKRFVVLRPNMHSYLMDKGLINKK